jgi:hypothetical protein
MTLVFTLKNDLGFQNYADLTDLPEWAARIHNSSSIRFKAI